VAVDTTGAVHVSGYFSGTVDTAPDAPGGELVSEATTIKPFVAKYTSNGAFDWVWSCSGSGQANADRVSAGAGNIWLAGHVTGPCGFDEAGSVTSPADADGTFLLSLSGDRSPTSFGVIQHGSYVTRVASTESSTFLVGFLEQPLDLDPGPGVDRRVMPGYGGYAVKFAGNGAFAWSQTFSGFEANDAVATTTGGVLVAGALWPRGAVILVNADASPGFTLDLGENVSPRALALGGGVLAIAGHVPVGNYQKYFLARYAFED
jgi:hypothetical protein